MKHLSINVEKRENIGRHASNRIRRSGKVPAVVYGKSGSQALVVDEKEMRTLLRAKGNLAAFVTLNIAGQGSILTLIEEIQRNAIKDHFVHFDFHEVSKTEKMNVSVSINIIGECVGVKNEGATLNVSKHTVNIKCLPANMPDMITVDVSDLQSGKAIHVRDLAEIDGVEFLDNKEVVIVSCDLAAAEEEPTSAEETAKPATDAAATTSAA